MADYYHSVILMEEKCTGCTVCMQNCPTQAIRVIDGKAHITPEKCIDCGVCIRVCPYGAKSAVTDTLKDLEAYDFKVAMPSMSFYSQFPGNFSKTKVDNALKTLGFDAIIDQSYYAEVIAYHLGNLSEDPFQEKPMISTYCPAITRLIQLKNPELIKNIIPIETPMEVAARLYKENSAAAHPEGSIGIFYISQCPAKITSIKKPLGLKKSSLDGALSTQSLYPLLMQILSHREDYDQHVTPVYLGESWSILGGQSLTSEIEASIKVDGIDEVAKILDMAELGKLSGIQFIETYACIGGCVGGPLNVENPFIARYRVESRTRGLSPIDTGEIEDNFDFNALLWDLEIEPLDILGLDKDLTVAMEKMTRIDRLVAELPGIDCGACGCPSCRSLAEDIVQKKASLSDCVFQKLQGGRRNESL
ncbi:MAG: hypothetical protein AVO33_06385 [delta proteobacterium ML8_F1]|nr:MAG: hypothetical protein AVO33_06385 [delta proteobacterium ML8_F1]